MIPTTAPPGADAPREASGGVTSAGALRAAGPVILVVVALATLIWGLIVGSGVTDQTVASMLSIADAVIVGTYFKVDGVVTNEVDTQRVRKLVAAAKS